jgi:hypothetical protein
MALQRAGIEAAVYEAHVPTDGEAGSYLTVATNGLDALRPSGPTGRCWPLASRPRPTVLVSTTGRRWARSATAASCRTGR